MDHLVLFPRHSWSTDVIMRMHICSLCGSVCSGTIGRTNLVNNLVLCSGCDSARLIIKTYQLDRATTGSPWVVHANMQALPTAMKDAVEHISIMRICGVMWHVNLPAMSWVNRLKPYCDICACEISSRAAYYNYYWDEGTDNPRILVCERCNCGVNAQMGALHTHTMLAYAAISQICSDADIIAYAQRRYRKFIIAGMLARIANPTPSLTKSSQYMVAS